MNERISRTCGWAASALILAALCGCGKKDALSGSEPSEASKKKFGDVVEKWSAKLPQSLEQGATITSVKLRESGGGALIFATIEASEADFASGREEVEFWLLTTDCLPFTPVNNGAVTRYEWRVGGKPVAHYEVSRDDCMGYQTKKLQFQERKGQK